jgi:glycosyltransferase involved in cell wall biosynthesis
MKIIYLTQHYHPETNAASFRADDQTRILAEKGYDIYVISGLPYDLELRKAVKSEIFKKQKYGAVTLLRVYTPIDKKKNSLVRLANYISFMFFSFWAGLFISRADIIYSSTPPLFVAITGLILSKLKRASNIIEVRDLWVDFAGVLNKVKNKWLKISASLLESFLLRRSTRVVVVTTGYKEDLINRGIPENKIKVIYNGVDFRNIIYKSGASSAEFDLNNDLEDKFKICFAGNMGLAQGLDVVIAAAGILKKSPAYMFLFVGEGADKTRLVRLAEEKKLTNIMFLPQQSRQKASGIISSADCGLITLMKNPLFHITIPSKLYEYMALSKPILLGLGGEARNILEQAGGGIYFDIDDPEALVEAIYRLRNNKELMVTMGSNGRKYVYEHFNREKIVNKLALILEEVADQGRVCK